MSDDTDPTAPVDMTYDKDLASGEDALQATVTERQFTEVYEAKGWKRADSGTKVSRRNSRQQSDE